MYVYDAFGCLTFAQSEILGQESEDSRFTLLNVAFLRNPRWYCVFVPKHFHLSTDFEDVVSHHPLAPRSRPRTLKSFLDHIFDVRR